MSWCFIETERENYETTNYKSRMNEQKKMTKFNTSNILTAYLGLKLIRSERGTGKVSFINGSSLYNHKQLKSRSFKNVAAYLNLLIEQQCSRSD